MIKIAGIEYYLPKKVLKNEDLETEFPEWSSAKISKKIGVDQRHISDENETALDLAVNASQQLFETYDRNKIDFILFCTQSPDYFLPTTACILQDRLQLGKNVGALDFNLGCSGFVYGLSLAKGLIAGGIANNILLVTAETYSKHLDPNDKSNRSIFGDAAAVTIIEKSTEGFDYQFVLGTDGSGYDKLIVESGAFRNGKSDNENHYLFMNGPEVFNFTIENIPGLVEETLAKNNLTDDDISYYVFHQANSFMLKYLRDKTGIAEEKFHIDMQMIGNTVSATIPIGLKDCKDQGRIKKGDKILIAGFGVGFSWGATIIEF